MEVFNEGLRDSELCDSMKSSITRLVYKKDDRRNLKNWRPISLLNVDYKICSKAISLRLSKVLDSIVDPDQTCSVPGRSIASNLFLLRDVLDHIERTGETGILVSLDQEKAFDRVDRTFLLNLLRHLGFGPSFLNCIHTLYNGANMRVIVNGFLSDMISIARGVRQGDSLSPMLYILCVEVLACKIRACSDIEGFLLPDAQGLQFKVGQYSDDTTSFVKDVVSLNNLFREIQLYERGTGAKLNISKTEAMWLGSWKDRVDQPLGLKWVNKMKILGVVFGTVPVRISVVHPASRRLTFVNVYDALYELPDSAIEERLKPYGRIYSHRRGKCQGYPDVFNGVRHLRMALEDDIPCFLRFGRFQVCVKYENQPSVIFPAPARMECAVAFVSPRNMLRLTVSILGIVGRKPLI